MEPGRRLPTLRPAFERKGTGVRLLVILAISQMKWTELPGVVKESLEGAECRSAYTRGTRSAGWPGTRGQAAKDLAQIIAAELKKPGMDWPLASNLTQSLAWCSSDSKKSLRC